MRKKPWRYWYFWSKSITAGLCLHHGVCLSACQVIWGNPVIVRGSIWGAACIVQTEQDSGRLHQFGVAMDDASIVTHKE